MGELESGSDEFLDWCFIEIEKDMVVGCEGRGGVCRFFQKVKCAWDFFNQKHPVWYRYDDKENRYLQLAE